MGFDVANKRSRIANLGGLAVHPDFRGRRLADEAARVFQRHLLLDLDYHRLQLEIYGFNERAIQHAERAGFIREGVKRKAYWRHGEWVDGVLFGLLREDLEAELLARWPAGRAHGAARVGAVPERGVEAERLGERLSRARVRVRAGLAVRPDRLASRAVASARSRRRPAPGLRRTRRRSRPPRGN